MKKHEQRLNREGKNCKIDTYLENLDQRVSTTRERSNISEILR